VSGEIVWEQHPATRSTWHGYVISHRGIKIRVFSINPSIERGGPSYVLRSDLPGYTKDRPAASVADGQRVAAVILDRFAEIITGNIRRPEAPRA
jgi:hypothetical protein